MAALLHEGAPAHGQSEYGSARVLRGGPPGQLAHCVSAGALQLAAAFELPRLESGDQDAVRADGPASSLVCDSFGRTAQRSSLRAGASERRIVRHVADLPSDATTPRRLRTPMNYSALRTVSVVIPAYNSRETVQEDRKTHV